MKTLTLLLISLIITLTNAQAYIVTKGGKWLPGSTIVYKLGQYEDPDDIEVFLSAASLWSVVGNINFLIITEPSSDLDFHNWAFLKKAKNQSRFPRIKGAVGGMATLGKSKLGQKSDAYGPYFFVQQATFEGDLHLGTTVHELGHNLGFSHEFEHPRFPEVYDLKEMARNKNFHCDNYVVMSGVNLSCRTRRDIDDRNSHAYIIDPSFDPNSSMNYSFPVRHYHLSKESVGRGGLSIPSIGDQRGMLKAYPGRLGEQHFEKVYSEHLLKLAKYCPRLGKVYTPGASGSPCKRNQYGFRHGSRKVCYKSMPEVFDTMISTCGEYFNVKPTYLNGARQELAHGKNVFYIANGRLEGSYDLGRDKAQVESIIEKQRRLEK